MEKPVEEPKKLADRRMRFSFSAQLWDEVLQWFAEEAGLSLVMDHPPQGSCNYRDDKEYSPIEGIDLLNKMLMPKRFTLIRNEQMLMVIDLSEGIPQGIVPVVTMEDLGIAKEGTAVTEVLDGEFDAQGNVPCQIDGGLKCFGHPIGASGLRMLYEMYLQFQGRAGDLLSRGLRPDRTKRLHSGSQLRAGLLTARKELPLRRPRILPLDQTGNRSQEIGMRRRHCRSHCTRERSHSQFPE